MNARIFSALLAIFSFAAMLSAAPPPATIPPIAPELTSRQKNLLLQLSDAEANIQAINKALVRTGYKVGVAYDRIDSNLKGNELMDRKGGGPVRWDAFYGKTARAYGNNGWGDRRPQQFDFIYRANDDQVSRARDQIVSLERNQEALLARRRKHEDDQSRLWAILAFEQIREREIDLHNICRFALKPAGPEADVLRPLVLFLRTADRVAADGLDSLQVDQPTTFRGTGQRMQSAYAELQKSLADALDGAALDPIHRKKGQAIKALCKELSEECAVIADNYANALDRDDAKQDSSKLEFRAQLQTSLYTFATSVGRLDDDVIKTAKEWNIDGVKGMPTPDAVTAPVDPPAAKPPQRVEGNNPPLVADEEKGWIELYDGKTLVGWEVAPGAIEAKWSVRDGCITGTGGHGYLSTRRSFTDFHLFVEARVGAGGNSGVFFRVTSPVANTGGWQDQISDATDKDHMKTGSLKYYGAKKDRRAIEALVAESPVPPGEWFTTEVITNGRRIRILVNGQQTVDFTDLEGHPKTGRIALECFHCYPIEFRRVRIKPEAPEGS